MKPRFLVFASVAAVGLPAQAATFTARTEAPSTVIIDARGGEKDETCGPTVEFWYVDAKSAPAAEKLSGAQICSPKTIPAGKTIEMCRIDYVGISDVAIKADVVPHCDASKTAQPKKAR